VPLKSEYLLLINNIGGQKRELYLFCDLCFSGNFSQANRGGVVRNRGAQRIAIDNFLLIKGEFLNFQLTETFPEEIEYRGAFPIIENNELIKSGNLTGIDLKQYF